MTDAEFNDAVEKEIENALEELQVKCLIAGIEPSLDNIKFMANLTLDELDPLPNGKARVIIGSK